MRISCVGPYFGVLAITALVSCGDNRSPPAVQDASAGPGDVGSGEVTGPLGTRADLPVDARIAIAGLGAPVDVVRDTDGRPHIYAGSAADAFRTEGWLVARDRTLQ